MSGAGQRDGSHGSGLPIDVRFAPKATRSLPARARSSHGETFTPKKTTPRATNANLRRLLPCVRTLPGARINVSATIATGYKSRGNCAPGNDVVVPHRYG